MPKCALVLTYVGLGVGLAVGTGVGGVGLAVGFGVGRGVGVAVGFGVGDAVGQAHKQTWSLQAAPENMLSISVTLDTSQLLRGWLKA